MDIDCIHCKDFAVNMARFKSKMWHESMVIRYISVFQYLYVCLCSNGLNNLVEVDFLRQCNTIGELLL